MAKGRREQAIPPILLSSTICLRDRLVCPGWIIPARAGVPNRPLALPDLVGITHPHRSRCGEAGPCSPWTGKARPTRLAPRCTLAQPAVSPLPLVGSYPTVSPLTSTLVHPQGCWRVCFLLRL